MFNILRAYGNLDRDVYYEQGYSWIVSMLLYYIEDEETVFSILCRLMRDLNWRHHYIKPYRMPTIVRELHDLVQLHLPNLHGQLQKDRQEDFCLSDHIENLYNYTMQSICVGPEIPIEVSARIFESIIFEDAGDYSLVRIILYMLMICEKDILAKHDPDVRWRYVSKGWFINDCIQNKANFSELRSKLESDMLFHFEQVDGIHALNESSGEVT